MTEQKLPIVSIILVNYNGAEVLPNCLISLKNFIDIETNEVIIVDNASTDGSPDIVAKQFPWINLIRLPENRGFGAGNNVGASIAKGEFLFLLNTDTILTNNILPHLIQLMHLDDKVGIIGPKLLNSDGSWQFSISSTIGIRGEYKTRQLKQNYQKNKNFNLIEQQYQEIQEVDIVVGAAFFIRSNLFHDLGGFDEKFFMYFEESDLCQRVRNQGYKVLYTPHVSLIHLHGQSIQKVANIMAVEYRRSQIYYYLKHRSLWEVLLLRIYLIYKFLSNFMMTGNQYSLRIVLLAVKA